MNKKSIATSIIAFASMVGLIALAGPVSADAQTYGYQTYQPTYGYAQPTYGTGYGYTQPTYSTGYGYGYGATTYDLSNYGVSFGDVYHNFTPYTPVSYSFNIPTTYTASAASSYGMPQTYGYQQPTYGTGYGYTQPTYSQQYQQPYYGSSYPMSQRAYGVPTGRTDFVGTQLCDYSSIGYYGAYDCYSDPRQPVQDVYTGQWY